MLRFRSLASGSSGNATLIESGDGLACTRVLVDCGLGWRQLQARLGACELEPGDLDAIFITHEHSDHLGCVAQLVARCGTPLWTSCGTLQAMRDAGFAGQANLARDGDKLAIGALQIAPFTVPHDAREPLQLTCTDGARRLGLLTDLGHVTAHAMTQLTHCHALVLESNHDPELLASSRYPPFLKRRVAGTHGHLSNAQAAQALATLRHRGLSTVVAAHLSERNNRPELARTALAPALGCNPQDVLVADRHGMAVGWLTV